MLIGQSLPAGVYVWWEDGYVISRITGGPLHPEYGTDDENSLAD